MNFDTFLLERNQSLYENEVEINLTESGVHASPLRELLTVGEIDGLLDLPLSYGHTEGTPEVRASIADWHPGASPANVLVTTGTSEANLVSLLALVEKGDDVVVVLPNFMQIPGLARALGAEIKAVNLDQSNNWKIDKRALQEAMSDRTRLIAVCNPNNPTGAVLDESDRNFLTSVAASSNSWLLVDEIYRGAELNNRAETRTFWGEYERTIVTGGMAKSFAHPGLRLGWLIAPEDVVYECMKRQDYTTIGTSPMSQYITNILLQPARRKALLDRGRSRLNSNLEILRRWVVDHEPCFSLVEPHAGGMAFLQYSAEMPSEEISTMLRKQEGVFVVAGSWFGLERSIRVGIGGAPEVLKEGLGRMGNFFDRLREFSLTDLKKKYKTCAFNRRT